MTKTLKPTVPELMTSKSVEDQSPEIKPVFVPVFDGTIKGWVVNYLRRNYWRIQRTMEYDDAVQEAHLLFLELVKRYPNVDTPQWFMTLFKRSWVHHFADMSVSDTAARNEVTFGATTADEDESLQSYIDSFPGDPDNFGMITLMIMNAPAEIRSVVALFLRAPTETLELACSAWKMQGKKNELGNQMLAKLLGLDPNGDVIQDVRDYFSK